jgi:hypothetical protein
MTAGLVGGEGLAVDASVIEANASRFERVKGSEVDWTDAQRARRPVQEYLVALESENPPINPKQRSKAMSPSDPSAAWTTRGRHKVIFGYSLKYLIDMADGDRSLLGLLRSAQEDRNAPWRGQADPLDGQAQTAGSHRRQGRVPADRHRQIKEAPMIRISGGRLRGCAGLRV